MFNFFKKKKNEVAVELPFAGRIVRMEDVDDPVFSQKLVGDGFAVIPDADQVDVKAPVDGVLSALFPTGHAFGIKMDNDFEVLVHLGIDTVDLKGEGFEILKQQGDRVAAGDVVIRMDVAKIKELGKDPVTPVVFTNQGMVKNVDVKEGAHPSPACVVELN